MTQCKTGPGHRPGRLNACLAGMAGWWLLTAVPALARAPGEAVDDSTASPAPPSVAAVAGAMSAAESRDDTLLAIAAMARVHQRLTRPVAEGEADLETQYASDLEWLRALRARFGPAPPRSPVLDPAAWQVQTQLQQYGLAPGAMASALGPGFSLYLDQALNRFKPGLAASVLPQLLWHLESQGTLIWAELLGQAAGDPRLLALLASLEPGAPVAEASTPQGADAVATAQRELELMVAELTGVGPPDPVRLGRLRGSLLSSMPEQSFRDRELSAALLHLSRLVDGLGRHRFTAFVEGLLAVVTQLDALAEMYPDDVAAFSTWLTGILPPVSESFARGFSGVDPHLNTALATAFDLTRGLARQDRAPEGLGNAVRLGDAVARLALLIPDMAFYFGQPVRDPVAGGVEACAGMVSERDPDGQAAMTREVFDDCQQTLLDLADDEGRQAQLAGDPDGPFAASNLERELGLAAVQRINYAIGYLHERFETGCEAPPRALPNPLEWAYLATFMAWLAEQSPIFYQTPENEQRLLRMREIGTELLQAMASQVDCVAGAGAGVNDPVARVSEDYRDSLAELAQGLRAAQQAFRSQRLRGGADLSLEAGADQPTAYRPDNLEIGPCDPEQFCEMNGKLSSTRALLGLFPDSYLLADQTGLGTLQICYDRMEWEDRRSEPVRSDDTNVANYYGHLAFDVRGRFVSEGEATDLFAYRFKSPQEHHYLFAAATPDVLQDSCPTEWVGTRIVTTLPPRRRSLVPNRLTYLSAPRTLPSRLLSRNWDRGAEWRDWFVTGLGVQRLPVEPLEDIAPRLTAHIQNLYHLEQEAVYGTILEQAATPALLPDPVQEARMAQLDTAKELVRSQVMLFYPRTLADIDGVRTAVAGHDGLVDQAALERFHADNIPVNEAVNSAQERATRFRNEWRALPEAVRRNGSVSLSLSNALVRLNALYDRHFARRPTAEPAPTGPGPGAAEDRRGDAEQVESDAPAPGSG